MSSLISCAYRDRLTWDVEEVYVRDFAPVLNHAPMDNLLLVNTMQRRYLFPLVHAIHSAGDVYVIRAVDGKVVIPDEQALARYRRLFVVDFYVDYEPETFLQPDAIGTLSDALKQRGFELVDSVASGSLTPRHSLLVFEKR